MDPFAKALNRAIPSLGRSLHECEEPPPAAVVLHLLEGADLIDDVDIFFAPELVLDRLSLFRNLARRRPCVIHWPGEIRGRRATYSEAGRMDP